MKLQDVSDDQAVLRRTYGCFPSGVTAICGLVNGEPRGLAASSFTSVSMDPPLVSVCVQDTSTTWPVLRGLQRVGVSVLAEGQADAGRALASRASDRFAELAWRTTGEGAVLMDGAVAVFDCSIEREVQAGDHDIVLLRIHALSAQPELAPLVFHGSRFRSLASTP